ERALARNVPPDRNAGRRAEETPGDAGGRELRCLARHCKIALRDELTASGGRRALHPRDDRLRQRRDGLHHAAALREEGLDPRQLLQRADLLDVVPRAKALPHRRQHHDAHALVLRDGVERFLERVEHLARQQVHLRRTVHHQRADAVAILAQQDGFFSLQICAHVSIAVADFALSRSTNFWILPVEVFGSSPNTTARGALNLAIWPRQNSTSSASVTLAPGLSSTNAHGVSPHLASGMATTAAPSTAGCRYRTSSTSSDAMFSPPEMMMSFERSRIFR